MRWPKYWSFSFSIIHSKEIPRLISFRMDWFDLLAVQGTLKSLLQHHSSEASILWHSAFFILQLSHPYMTTGKTIALTRQTSVGKITSLLFNILSAAAAKSLQSCPTLCDPIDNSPPGSPVPGILQARTLEWVAISFSSACTGVGCHCLLRKRLFSNILKTTILFIANYFRYKVCFQAIKCFDIFSVVKIENSVSVAVLFLFYI